jgi:hypothetical protein
VIVETWPHGRTGHPELPSRATTIHRTPRQNVSFWLSPLRTDLRFRVLLCRRLGAARGAPWQPPICAPAARAGPAPDQGNLCGWATVSSRQLLASGARQVGEVLHASEEGFSKGWLTRCPAEAS